MLFLTPVPRRCALNFGSTFSAWPIGLGVAGRVATVDLNLIRQIWEIDLYYNWKGFFLVAGSVHTIEIV